MDIAGLLSSVLRAHLRAYDPVFSMAMRYLIRFHLILFYLISVNFSLSLSLDVSPIYCSIHRGFSFRQGFSSPVADLTERLLLDERDPPATPQESSYEAPPFDEVGFISYKDLFVLLLLKRVI